MRAEPVDPRDSEVVLDGVTYRVYIWSKRGGSSADGMSCREWRLTDVADVRDVVRWAGEQVISRDEAFEIFAEIQGSPRTLLRLVRLDEPGTRP